MSPALKSVATIDFVVIVAYKARVVLACTAVILAAAPGLAGVAAVWAVSDGEKVERDERAHPLKPRNAVWDGTTIRLASARNEIVAFQVIVEADVAGVRALTASLRELRRRGGGETIAYAPKAADPSLSAGRPIQLFAVHYMNVTAPSRAEWAWMPDTPAAPRDPTGWKPVQLVPENARSGRGGFPLAVGASLGQSLWIEIYVERDRPAGVYEGTLAITADGKAKALPVELRVFDFALPDENSLKVMVYYEPDQPELYQGRNLDAAFHRFAHRHRVELVNAYDEATIEAHRGRFDGKDFTRAAGYEGPGEGIGNTIAPASFYGPGRAFLEKESAWKRSDAWMAFVARTLPNAVTFLYLPDEPYPPQYPEVRRLADNVRSNPGPGGKLPTFVTKRLGARAGRGDRHLVRAHASFRPGGRGGGAPQGPPCLGVQRRAPARARAAHRHARHGPARRALGLLQARRAALLLLALRALEAQQPEAGRAGAGCLGQPGHVRQPRPAAQARRRPGLPERRRRPALSGRGEATPRGGPRHRGADRHACSSPTCAAASRTTST